MKAPSPKTDVELRIFYSRYRKALKKVIEEGGCLCGGQGYDPGFMYHIEGQEKDRFGHSDDDCGPMIAAKALGLKVEQR